MLNSWRNRWSRDKRRKKATQTTNARRFQSQRRRLTLESLEDRRVFAVEFLDPHPAAGNQFGHSVVPLSNGNVVITAPFDDLGGVDAGAVYLFNGSTGALISSLRGSNHLDNVGLGGITPLANGNFVVSSPNWHLGFNGPTVGAATWVQGTTGLQGTISSSNSLIGSAEGDGVGNFGSVVALPNGNYVVVSAGWDIGENTELGAVTWANGSTGLVGVVSSANSLTGTSLDDRVGQGGIRVLENGNFVVLSPDWNNGSQLLAGAVTWVNGSTGLVGTVSSSNSLVGTKSEDHVGLLGIEILPDSHFVVANPLWDNGAAIDAGAVTWVNGATGISGPVSAANSLVGTTTNDNIGGNGINVLQSGNYVVSNPLWNHGSIVDAGAVTWASGATGISGPVSNANSLVGSQTGDLVGSQGIAVLSNGHYVVASPSWNSGAVIDAGAVTWGNGTTGTVGPVSSANSIVGAAANHSIGAGGVTPLTNGNYVIGSPLWDAGPTLSVGAVTWVQGSTAATGTVTSANSLVGSKADDLVGQLIIPLSNGNYVVGSPSWDNGSVVNAGAATWRSGTSAATGIVGSANSLIGANAGDQVGTFSAIVPLSNGNYVVVVSDWDHGSVANVGAVVFGAGSGGISGQVSASNSFIGATAEDRLGNYGVTALANGNYLIHSSAVDIDSFVNAGAVTLANGVSGLTGVVSASNSLVGSSTNDSFGAGQTTLLSNGSLVVSNPFYKNGPLSFAGAVTWNDGISGMAGPVVAPSDVSVAGSVASSGLYPVVVDDVNNAFFVRFLTPGIVRRGSQTIGFAEPIVPSLTATFTDGNLTIVDSDGVGKANTLTVSRVNVAGVDYLQFADSAHAFVATPTTSPASLLSNFDRTLRVPVSAITGILTLDLRGGDDALTLDLSGGDVIPAGGLQFLGGAMEGSTDRLSIVGGHFGDVTHTYANATDGNLVSSTLGTIQYAGIDSISHRAALGALTLQLPLTGTVATLADDGTSGNGLTRIAAGTITTTDFSNPQSLSIVRGSVSDQLVLGGLPDLSAGLLLGSSAAPFQSMQFQGAIALASNASLAAYALGAITLSNSNSDLLLTGSGGVTLAGQVIQLAAGSSISTTAGDIRLESTLQPIAAETGLTLHGALTTTLGAIALNADSVLLDSVASLSASSVQITTFTPGRAIHLGTADAATHLGLTDAELDRITTAALTIGNATSGAITVSEDVSRVSATALQLNSATEINFTTGRLLSGGGTVLLAAPSIQPATSGVDVAATGSTVSFGSDSQLRLAIQGTTVDSLYQQLNVAGTLNVTGTSLTFSGVAPGLADNFVVVNNDGVDPIVGTFTGMPEGALVSVNGVLKRLTYTGGDGNDVALLANTAPTLDAIGAVNLSEDASPPSVTLTGITAGAESQLLRVSATTDNEALITLAVPTYVSPATTGTLPFTLVANAHGAGTVTVTVRDAGFDGVFDNADDLWTTRTFSVTVQPVNDVPSFVKGSDLTVPFNSGLQSFPAWATSVSPGPANESGQSVSFVVASNSDPLLFSVQPTISSTGQLTFTPAANAVGSATITVVAQDNGGTLLGGVDTSASQTFTITINPPPPTLQVVGFTPTATGFVAVFSREVDPTTLNLYYTQAGGAGPADITLTGSLTGVVRGTALLDATGTQLTFVSTSGVLPADSYTLTLRSDSDAFREVGSPLLDGDANGTAGGDYVHDFVVTSPAGNAVAVSIPNIARGPQQSVQVPATAATGIPLSLSDAAGITSATFEFRYDPSLLQIEGASVAAGLPTGAMVLLDTSTPGVAIVQFSSSTPLSAGMTHFVNLQASVPATAPYLQKQVLDLANISLNGGAIPAIDDDGVHVAAYFGDVTANGTLTAQDAAQIARLAVGLDNGFAPYAMLDPVVIGDINGNGSVSSTDIVRMLQVAVALPTPEVPALPIPAVSLVSGGPDPKLSIPTNLTANAGDAFEIPVMIDSIVDLTGNGLESADLVIYYDPAVLDITSVTLGDLLSGLNHSWSVAARIDPLAGRIFISAAGSQPLEGMFVGELLQLHATVKASAPAGSSALNLAASSHNPSRATQLNEGYLTLIPAPTDAADDPGVDGRLTIVQGGAPPASEPVAVRAGQQLVVTGTTGDDFIYISPISESLVRVRVGRRILGEFPIPEEIIVDSLTGNDYVFVSPSLPQPLAAGGSSAAGEDTSHNAEVATLTVTEPAEPASPSGNASVQSRSHSLTSPASTLTPHDLALLQLLTSQRAWAEDSREMLGIRRRR
jgi:hypothetical protein